MGVRRGECHLPRYGDGGPGRGRRVGRRRESARDAGGRVSQPRERAARGRPSARPSAEQRGRGIQDSRVGWPGPGAGEGSRAGRRLPLGLRSALQFRGGKLPGADDRSGLAARRPHRDSRSEAESRVRDRGTFQRPGLSGLAAGVSALVPRRLGAAWPPPRRDPLQRLGPPAAPPSGTEPARSRCDVVRRRG